MPGNVYKVTRGDPKKERDEVVYTTYFLGSQHRHSSSGIYIGMKGKTPDPLTEVSI